MPYKWYTLFRYRGDAGRDRGIAFLKHHVKNLGEHDMARFLRALSGFFMSQSKFEQDMMTFAKTEYKYDWQYAYDHLVTHNGKPPRYTYGVTQ